jgi:hypothetical protein
MMDEIDGTEASRQLRALAREIATVYVAELRPRAVILTGSAAEGVADDLSDLDLIAYHDRLPAEAVIEAARHRAGGGELLVLSAWDGKGYVESFPVRGVECQVAHATVEAVERHVTSVLVELDVESVYQKALDGLLHAIPLHGAELVRSWQQRAADYPETLRKAMVERHMRFFPLWMTHERMASRDATLWRQQMLVESALRILAVLAGLNRVYFSSFQFKRMHAFAARLAVAPPDVANRLERLFDNPHRAGEGLEALVVETLALVERELPDLDTIRARRWVGRRPEPWDPSSSPAGHGAAPD